jgi:RNA recognition motif-containing protein
MYDEGQAAQSVSSFSLFWSSVWPRKAFRKHDMFKLQPINGLGSPARAANAVRSPSSDSARAYLARYEIDRRSIFVGNLPVGINEDEIKNIFEQYGQIQEIIIKESASKFEGKWLHYSLQIDLTLRKGQEKVCFAFVEFVDPISVSNAISKKVRKSLSRRTFGAYTLSGIIYSKR